jgi:riboflavin kinase/FMN adenylyltransferase
MNVVPEDSQKLLPADGVYAVRGDTERGSFSGMMNLGGRPTFGELERALEVHAFDSEGVPYGSCVSVTIVHRLRNVMRFAGPDALVAQLANDARAARLALTQA